MGILFANHASSQASEVVAIDATEIQCALENIGSFPSIEAPDDYFYLSLIPMGYTKMKEVVRVIALDKTAAVMTVERGVDGTTPVEHKAGTKLEIRIPAIALNDILKIANEGLDGPKLERFPFNEPALEWVVEHNRGTTLFDEKLWVKDEDGIFRKHLAATEVIDGNSFRIRFACAVSGHVDIRF